MAGTPEELLRLERVFLRIGSAETDEQLENVVNKFLPPLLHELSSQQEGVRKKVMELLVHVNKRLKTRPSVLLPIDALLAQYGNPTANAFVTNFTIIYIRMGYPRLTAGKQAELIPKLLSCLENRPKSHQDSLLLMMVPTLSALDAKNRQVCYEYLKKSPEVCTKMLSFMLDVLLLPYGSNYVKPADVPRQGNGSEPQTGPPPGMTEGSFKTITGEAPIKAETLEQMKLNIVTFLSGEAFRQSDILIHFIVAAADTRFSVASYADQELKKVICDIDWESERLAIDLYQLYLGSNLQGELKISPASTRIRQKLMQYFVKFHGKAFCLQYSTRAVFDSLFGTNTHQRLKSLSLNFAANIIRQADLAGLMPYAPAFLTSLNRVINCAEPALQSQAYVLMGHLGRRFPALIWNDITLLETFFKNLTEAGPEMKHDIREGLLNLVSAFKFDQEVARNMSKSELEIRQNLLHALLSYHLESTEDMVRFVAVRYIAAVFPPNHIQSKYLLLLATGDNKDEVSLEALKSLYGPKFKQGLSDDNDDAGSSGEPAEKIVYAPFAAIVSYIYSEANSRLKRPKKCYSKGNHVLAFSPKVYSEMLQYVRCCMVQTLGVSRRLPAHPTEATPKIGKLLRNLQSEAAPVAKDALQQYLSLLQRLVVAAPDVEALACTVEVVGCVPSARAALGDDLQWVRKLLDSTREDLREQAAVLYALMVAGSDEAVFDQKLKGLLEVVNGNGKNIESLHGCLLALANCLERWMAAGIGYLALESCHSGVQAITAHLTNQNATLVSAACVGIGLVGGRGPLPLADDVVCQEDSKKPKIFSKKYLVETLLGIMNNVKYQMRIRERAARALGLICVGEIFPYTKDVLVGFLKTAKNTKDVEVHFTIGESLVMCVQTIWSPEARDAWTTLADDFTPQNTMLEAPSEENLDWLLEELFKYVSTPHPHSRQATCIWLLALLKKCPKRKPILSNLKRIQNSFLHLLSENNDIVVDVASKGLGLVYEASDEQLRQELQEQLLNQLSSGRRAVPQVTSDTTLFEEGQLGVTPTGGKLTTYKELCSLASDLNKPDLIYKFMHLANHNTIWNSKKGAAFGFSTIFAKAGEQLKPHLPKIIPRLYRYQFDPNPNIQNSMQRIWHVLVPETQKVVDQYYKEILTDLLANLTANEWRVRQSCCLALSDFLRSGGNRSVHDCIKEMPDMWGKLFRVMDDVHEGTRLTATTTTKVLSKLCIRACDSSQGKSGGQMVKTLLPILLNGGITNTVAEVRAISLQTVSQIVNSAGSLLKPFLPVLIPDLLQATGELEPGELSRISAMYGGQSETQEMIDAVRASAAQSHLTTETMVKCLQYADSSILNDLVPKVADLMKSNVRLGTRVACAHFIRLLSTQMGKELQPHAGRLLGALLNGLLDRNSAVRKQYASSIGHVAGTAKEASLEKLFARLNGWYFEKDDHPVRTACAQTIQAIATHNQDVLKNYSDVIMPMVFFAMHAEKTPETQSTIEIWNDIWSENCPGMEGGIRQNIDAICATLRSALDSNSWNMKAQAANAISTIASKMGSNLESKHLNNFVGILLSGLSGRTWEGKEKLLNALSSICKNCKDAIKAEGDGLAESIVDAVMKECRKENVAYKQEALKAIGEILSSLEIDRFEQLYDIVKDTMLKDSGIVTKESDEEAEETNRRREDAIKLQEIVYETLGKAWPESIETQEKYRILFAEHCLSCLSSATRTVQVAVLSALCLYVDKLKLDSDKHLDEIMECLLKALRLALGVAKYTRLRKEALNVIISLSRRLQENDKQGQLTKLKVLFDEASVELEKDHQPEIKSRLVDIKDLLK